MLRPVERSPLKRYDDPHDDVSYGDGVTGGVPLTCVEPPQEWKKTTTDRDTRTRLTVLAGKFLDMANGP